MKKNDSELKSRMNIEREINRLLMKQQVVFKEVEDLSKTLFPMFQNETVFCPICNTYFHESEHLKTVIDNKNTLWLANMVTHYRHTHIKSWNKCWDLYSGNRYRSGWFADYDTEKTEVNERAKRQIIRKCTDYLSHNEIHVTDFEKLDYNSKETIELARKKLKPMNINPKFSFFKAPVTNTRPWKNITLFDAYRAIVTGYLKEPTNQLRQITDKVENRNFKATQFAYCTFSGMFTQRNENSLIRHSGLIAIDIDHIQDIDSIRKMLLKDPYFETQLLFTSPNGNGLKWVIHIDISEKYTHATMFQAIFNYMKSTYNIEIDKACKDVSRATFLCFDPKVYINPKYLVQ